jgi:hypothetical protein
MARQPTGLARMRPERPAALACLAWIGLALGGLLPASASKAQAQAELQPQLQPGEGIYLHGALPSGLPLLGDRGPGARAQGQEVACVNCHRHSGLGGGEGTIRIAPITSRYLYTRTGVQAGRVTLGADLASDAHRAAYDDATLAAAIREGVGRGGLALSYLMPRYQLDDADMRALISYLKTLPTEPSPGVSESTIDLATIITPDADPVQRDAMLGVLQAFIADKNAFIRGGARPMQAAEHIGYRVTRRWQLHVWTLTGAATTWEAQLHEHLVAEPVFAVLSGIGAGEWAPVHRFCQAEHLPCLFPNVAVPTDAEQDFYNVYLSRGLLLDASLIASDLRSRAAAGGLRLLQVYSAGRGGDLAAARLQELVAPTAGARAIAITAGDRGALERAIAAAGAGDTLVLWLTPADLALLGAPPSGVRVYVAGGLAGLEDAPLPAAWRPMAALSYPVDLPSSRATRMTYPLRWMQIHGMPPSAVKVQADTYLACGIVSEALNEMQDSFMRDFALERIETMVSHRQLSAYYPRLGLAPGQRFASKGGYLVRFSEPTGTAITPLGDWIVP